jgi:hypothetical protein
MQETAVVTEKPKAKSEAYPILSNRFADLVFLWDAQHFGCFFSASIFLAAWYCNCKPPAVSMHVFYAGLRNAALLGLYSQIGFPNTS